MSRSYSDQRGSVLQSAALGQGTASSARQATVDREPSMVLIEAVKDGKKGIKVEKPLILYEEKDVYSEEMRRDYGF